MPAVAQAGPQLAGDQRWRSFVGQCEQLLGFESLPDSVKALVLAQHQLCMTKGSIALMPRPIDDRALRIQFAKELDLLANKGHLDLFDRLRDIHRLRLAARWPTLAERVTAPQSYDGAILCVEDALEILRVGRIEVFISAIAWPLREASTAHGLHPEWLANEERDLIHRSIVHGQMKPQLAEDILVTPLYDGRRVRLVGPDGKHALTLAAGIEDAEPISLGLILGVMDNMWQVVGYD